MSTTYEILLAVALLTAAPGTQETTPLPSEWPTISHALQDLAIERELMDPRETRYLLQHLNDFQKDLDTLRSRYQDLKDVPCVADGNRFPERAYCNRVCSFNRAFRRVIESRIEFESDRADVLRETLRETDELYCIWDTVRDSRCEFYYVNVRRKALKKLKALVGEDRYLSGDLPCYVPEWRFVEITR